MCFSTFAILVSLNAWLEVRVCCLKSATSSLEYHDAFNSCRVFGSVRMRVDISENRSRLLLIACFEESMSEYFLALIGLKFMPALLAVADWFILAWFIVVCSAFCLFMRVLTKQEQWSYQRQGQKYRVIASDWRWTSIPCQHEDRQSCTTKSPVLVWWDWSSDRSCIIRASNSVHKSCLSTTILPSLQILEISLVRLQDAFKVDHIVCSEKARTGSHRVPWRGLVIWHTKSQKNVWRKFFLLIEQRGKDEPNPAWKKLELPIFVLFLSELPL